MRFVPSILVLLSLIACTDIQSQTEPSLASLQSSTTPSPELIATLESTDTPQPTVTPEPTSTPSPVPRSTITSTPTPMLGDTRSNPDTGQEESYNEADQWVEVIQIGDVKTGQGITETWNGQNWEQIKLPTELQSSIDSGEINPVRYGEEQIGESSVPALYDAEGKRVVTYDMLTGEMIQTYYQLTYEKTGIG